MTDTAIHFKKPPLQRTLSNGTRYLLVSEGECQVCRTSHPKNILQKLLHSTHWRKWETHKLILSESNLTSSNVSDIILYPDNSFIKNS